MGSRVLNRRDKVITDAAMIARIYDETKIGSGVGVKEYYLDRVELVTNTPSVITIPAVNPTKGLLKGTQLAPGGFIKDEPDGVFCNVNDDPTTTALSQPLFDTANQTPIVYAIEDGVVVGSLVNLSVYTDRLNFTVDKVSSENIVITATSPVISDPVVVTDLHFVIF